MAKRVDCKKTTCRERIKSPSKFDRRSFRMVSDRKGGYIIVACPKGKWSTRTRRCKVGLRAQSHVRPMSSAKCKVCPIRRRKR